MAKQTTKQTQRQKQSFEASRKKARRKRSHWLTLRLKIAGGTFLALVFTASAWLWYSGALGRFADAAVAKIDSTTIKLGFDVETIYLDGRSRTSAKTVEEALKIGRGAPILTVSLSAARKRLESIPTVKSAVVERSLPNTLHIKLIEREPVAIWQYKQKLALIDDTGAVMNDLSLENHRGLPLLIGEGVPENIDEAIEIFNASRTMSGKIAHITRMGNRRWDVGLQKGFIVKLPEHEFVEAWVKFAGMEAESNLTEKAIKSVDMRDPTRIIVQKAIVPAPIGKNTRFQET